MQRIIIAIAALLILVIVWFGISAARHEAEKVIEHQVETKIINVVKPLAPKVVPKIDPPFIPSITLEEPQKEGGKCQCSLASGSCSCEKPGRECRCGDPKCKPYCWRDWVKPIAVPTGTWRYERPKLTEPYRWVWYGNPKKQAASGCANGMCSPRGGGVF